MSALHYNTSGRKCASDDPKRLLWYGLCFYWTDDWNKLGRTRGSNIPCCPVCGAVGYQITFDKWIAQALEYERNDRPGYVAWLDTVKETCNPDSSQWKQEAKGEQG